MSEDAARDILRMKFRKPDLDRIHHLSTLAKRGALSSDDRLELDGLLKLGSLLTEMHSRARVVLKRPVKPRRKSA